MLEQTRLLSAQRVENLRVVGAGCDNCTAFEAAAGVGTVVVGVEVVGWIEGGGTGGIVAKLNAGAAVIAAAIHWRRNDGAGSGHSAVKDLSTARWVFL